MTASTRCVVPLHVPHAEGGARRRRARRARGILTVLSTPLIYLQSIPLAALDLGVSLYQRICFPIYGIALVPRRRYFVLDRQRLAYLSLLEKLNCTYCAYANGVIAYTREVTARTEAYWCPIRHHRRIRDPHHLYAGFTGFGDAAGYRRALSLHRARLRRQRTKDPAP